jgi:acetyl esterase/lipase
MSGEDFDFQPDIPFKTTASGKTLKVDLFRPLTPHKATLLYAHGGGFSNGSRRDKTAERLAKILCPEGVAIASVDYRLKAELNEFNPEQARAIDAAQARTPRVGMKVNPNYCGPRFYAAVEDMSDAVAFLRAKDGPLQSKTGRILALGASSGGIAALSLAHPPRDGWEDLAQPDAVIGLSAAMVQPWRLSAKGPPGLLFHGCHDGVISPRNARFVAKRAAAKSAPLEVIITEVRGHRQQIDLFIDGVDPEGNPWLDKARQLMQLPIQG